MNRIAAPVWLVALAWVVLGPKVSGQMASNSATGISYASVQAAVNAATNNYTVYLQNAYVGSSTVSFTNKTNVLLTTVFSSPTPQVIQSASAGVGVGITLTNCVNVTISNIKVVNWAIGIRVDGGSLSNQIVINQVISNSGSGVRLEPFSARSAVLGNLIFYPGGTSGDGVFLNGSPSNTVAGNAVSNLTYGFSLTASSNNFVASNTVNCSNAYGIYAFTASSGNTFLSNRIFGVTSGVGIQSVASRSNQFISNFVSGTSAGFIGNNLTNCSLLFNEIRSNATTGVDLQGGLGNIIGSNRIQSAGGTAGMNLDTGTQSNWLVSNYILEQTYGLSMSATTPCSNNFIFQNRFRSNTSRFIWFQSGCANNLIAENDFLTTNIGSFAIQLQAPSDYNNILSNVIQGMTTGIFCQNSTSNQISYNQFLSNDTAVWVQGAPSKGHVISSNTVINPIASRGIYLTIDSTSNRVMSNYIQGPTNGIELGDLNFSTNHFIFANDLVGCAAAGIKVNGKAHFTTVIGNRLNGGGSGLVISPGATNTILATNLFQNFTTGAGAWFVSNTNIQIYANTFTNSKYGLIFGPAMSGSSVSNNIFNNLNLNVSNLTTGLDVRLNFWGPGNRDFAAKKISPSVAPLVDPWFNGLTGSNSDFFPPSAPSSLSVTNGLPGLVHVVYTALTPADFGSFVIYRTRTSNAYSNLTDTEFLVSTNDSSASAYIDRPTNGGYYYYYVTVRDQNGNESTYSPQAAVNYVDPPVASFISPATNTTNLTSIFSSTSTKGTGNITNYRWDFGDGASASGPTLSNTSHIYFSSTNTFAILTLDSDLGQRVYGSNAIQINAPPTAGLTLASVVATNSVVTFTSTSIPGNSVITQYLWGFGDGSSAVTTNGTTSHTYSLAMTTNVFLTVLDALGQSNTAFRGITVNAVAAPWIAAPSFGTTNIPVSFLGYFAAGTALVTNFRWDFGDGGVVSGPAATNVNHTFTGVATPNVTFTVFDNLGFSNTAVLPFTVGAFYQLGGLLTGHNHAVTFTLAGPSSAVTNSGTNGSDFYQFWVSNGTYTISPQAIGYSFTPASRTVTVSFAPSTNENFVASRIAPVLSLAGLSNFEKVKREKNIQLEGSPASMFQGNTVVYTIASNGAATPLISNSQPYGTGFIFDTTLLPDGDYVVTATTTDMPFGRTQTLLTTLHLDNNLFKILSKGLEAKQAIVFDTVRRTSLSQPLEIYFYLKAKQSVSVTLYDKRGRAIKSFPPATYPVGPNLVVWDLIPQNLEAGVYYAQVESGEFSKSIPVVFVPK